MHLITGDLYAGAERVQELLADHLPAVGYEVFFVCLKQGDFERKLAEGPRDATTIAMRSRIDLLKTSRRIARLAREQNCRVIHTHTARGVAVGSLAAIRTGLPLVHHVHSPTVQDTSHRASDLLNACVERVSLLRVQTIIPVSESLAHRLSAQGHSKRRICTVHNGVAESDAMTAPTVDRELRLGMVALFRARKGLDVLLWAMAKLKRQGVFVQLRAVGEFETEEYQQEILRLVDELGLSEQIEWRGFRSDVGEELSAVDALVLPSLFGEGLPMVVLEAMAAGLPIVASGVEGVPEAVRDGQEGLLVPPGNIDALADALARIASDPDATLAMGRAARNRQRASFSDRAMAEGIGRIYDRLLDPAPAAVQEGAPTS